MTEQSSLPKHMTRTRAQIIAPNEGRRDLAKFDPEKTHIRVPAYLRGIRHAKRIADWEALDQAIDEVVDSEIVPFVAWWDEYVSPTRDDARPPGGKKLVVSKMKQPEHLTVAEAFRLTHVRKAQVSKWRGHLQDIATFKAWLRRVDHAPMWGVKDNVRGTVGGGNNEWFTPDQCIELVRAVLGTIDLDSASSDTAQQIVKAAEYFTKEDDGLKQEWCGRIWLNPPYSRSLIGSFIDKLIQEYGCHHVTAAIVLSHSYTSSQWFQNLAAVADAICFPKERIRFVDERGEKASPTQGQAFFYLGPERDKFIRAFGKLGLVVVPAAINLLDAPR